MGRGDLSDAEWKLIRPMLPLQRGHRARPVGDNRRFLDGMLHVLRVGYPCRDIHERYGKWNSVHVQFPELSRTGCLGCALANTGRSRTDRQLAAHDRQHQRSRPSISSGRKRGVVKNAPGRSPGSFTSKIHVHRDNQGLPLGFILTGGEAADYAAAEPLMDIPLTTPKALLADKGYDGDCF